MCTDEEAERKCPSGCRLQGLIEKAKEAIYDRVSKICDELQHYKNASLSTMHKIAQFYEAQRKVIIKTYMNELRYAEAAERLNGRLTQLTKISSHLSRELLMYHSHISEQINQMQRLEVDIDIKLRACKGSCKQTFEHLIDNDAYENMKSDMATVEWTFKKQNWFSRQKKIKLQPIVRPLTSLSYRKIPLVRSKLLTKFEDIEQNQVVIDEVLDAEKES